jgi:sec-independent protein translocase protein TatA
MGSVGPWELALLLAIAILLFGPGRLAGLGKAAGKTIREFREALGTGESQDSAQDRGNGGHRSPLRDDHGQKG